MAVIHHEFTGGIGRDFTSLQVGVGTVLRVDTVDGSRPPMLSTVHLEPGDVLVTTSPVDHPELRVVEREQLVRPAVDPASRRAPTVDPDPAG